MSQVMLIAQIETLRKFIIDNLSLDINQMARSEYLLDFIKDNIEKTNKVVFQTSLDGEVQTLLTAAQQQLTSFNQNKNEAHFKAYLTNLVKVIRIVPTPLRKSRDKQKDTLSSVASHAQNLVSALNANSTELEEKITDLDATVSQLQTSANETVSQTNKKIETFADSFETSSNEKIEKFITEQQVKIDSLVAEQEQFFSNLVDTKNSELSDVRACVSDLGLG